MYYMNSRWGRWSNLWFYADTETLSPEDNPSQTGSSVDRGEFRPIIKDFSFPLISLGHFYVFFSSNLSAAMSCWFTHPGRKARRPRETVPSTPPFFTLFSLCYRRASLSHSGDLQLPFLTSNKTLLTHKTVALCQDTQSYGCLKCI